MPPEYTQKERNQVYDKLRALLDSKDNELDEDSRLGNNEQEGEQEGGTEGSEKGEDEDRLGEQEAGIEGSEKGEDEDRRLGKFRFEWKESEICLPLWFEILLFNFVGGDEEDDDGDDDDNSDGDDPGNSKKKN